MFIFGNGFFLGGFTSTARNMFSLGPGVWKLEAYISLQSTEFVCERWSSVCLLFRGGIWFAVSVFVLSRRSTFSIQVNSGRNHGGEVVCGANQVVLGI